MRTRSITLVCWLLAVLVLTGCGTRSMIRSTGAPRPALSSATPTSIQTTTPSLPPQPKQQATTSVKTQPAPAAVTRAVRSVEPSATVGALVLDRRSGQELVAVDADRQFRSASLVKLLIAIDALARGADAGQRQRIATMLSRSDDAIASSFWVADGGSAIVTRTATRIGLTRTKPPKNPGQWGDALITAHDIGRIYQFILSRIPEGDRALIVDALASAPRIAADGFDQHFGIPGAFGSPWAIKQGWSNSPDDIVLHTSGLVGENWRYVVVVLTAHPIGVSWATARTAVTAGAKSLVPLL